MRFDEAVRRLATLPDPLPAAPAELMPVFTDGRVRPSVARVASLDRPAAVLVLVAPDADGAARIVLMERPTYDGLHSGEVSLPGGKVEPGDRDLVETALREAREEVGLDVEAAGVRVISRLEEVWIPVSRFSLAPILAVAERPPVLVADPTEVARIFLPRLATFLPGAPIRIVERTVREWPLRFGAYPVETADGDELLVWGATARILGQLGAVLGGRSVPGGPVPD